MKKKHSYKPSVGVINLATSNISQFITVGELVKDNKTNHWLWGSDDLLPQALAMVNRRGSIQRALLNSKTIYCTGKGFTTKNSQFEEYSKSVNLNGQSLRSLFNQLLYDKFSQGNVFTEIVTNGSFVFVYRHDPLYCRVGKDSKQGYILLNSQWEKQEKRLLTKYLPIYPNFEKDKNGLFRSIIHIKDDEQGFQNYGLPSYIAGLQVAAIAYKTDKWNLSRVENSFHSSAIVTVSDQFESDEDAENLKKQLEEKYTGEGTQGKVVFIVKGINDGETTVEQLSNSSEGDWEKLHDSAKNDLIIAHSWFRSLTGIADNTGFDTKRILNEYQIALNTVIQDEQQKFIEVFQKIFSRFYDISDLAIINKPPVDILMLLTADRYVKKSEARQMAGLEVLENDETMNEYVSTNEQVNIGFGGNQ